MVIQLGATLVNKGFDASLPTSDGGLQPVIAASRATPLLLRVAIDWTLV